MTQITSYTIGFTKKSAEKFFTDLRESGAQRIIDVRLNRSSTLSGFARDVHLPFFLKEICDLEYVHIPELAPTKPMLEVYKKHNGEWSVYAREFLELMDHRAIQTSVPREMINGGCLLCSEHLPKCCHRRLVLEYLAEHWGEIRMKHLT